MRRHEKTASIYFFHDSLKIFPFENALEYQKETCFGRRK